MPAGDVPHGIADQRREHREREHRRELRAERVRMQCRHRAEQDERRHGRHRQSDRGGEHVDEHDERPEAGDEIMKHDETLDDCREARAAWSAWMRRLSAIFGKEFMPRANARRVR